MGCARVGFVVVGGGGGVVVVGGGGGAAAGGGVGAVAMVKTQQGKQIDKHALTLLRGNGQSNTDTFH